MQLILRRDIICRLWERDSPLAEPTSKRRIFLSACEPSAEIHCANLIRTAKAQGFENAIEWVGIGGSQMEKAGCTILENTVRRAAMLHNAFGQIGFFYRVLKQIRSFFETHAIDLVIVCDSPAFNFHVAKAARRAGIPVLFYVAPQLWAWAPWRIAKLRKSCTKLACILPFEEDWFCGRNIDAKFVGNPLFDDITIDFTEGYKDYTGYDPRKVKVALFPGSRNAEIKTLWPAMQRIAIQIKQKWPEATFTACAAGEEKLEQLRKRKITGLKCDFTVGNVYETADQADFALVASGSATLQVAAAGCPMVILYQSSRILWHLVGRWLIRTRFLSLVNILAGREVVTEFMPYFSSIRPVADRCSLIIGNRTLLMKTSMELENLVAPLTRGSASQEVLQMALSLIPDPGRQEKDQALESHLRPPGRKPR